MTIVVWKRAKLLNWGGGGGEGRERQSSDHMDYNETTGSFTLIWLFDDNHMLKNENLAFK